MDRNCLFAISVLAVLFCAQPARSYGQDNSKERGEQAEPLDHLGPGVTPPRATYSPDPEYDDASRRAKLSGSVVLSIVVTKEGNVGDPKIVQSLSPNLDKQAVKAVSKWKFTPAMRDGKPIAVQIKVEVTFRIR